MARHPLMSAPRSVASQGTVLVIDDEAMLRTMLCRALLEAGFDAVEAENGEEALRVAASCASALRLAVTDVTMPVMSGIEFAREFRPRWPRVPILFITGKNSDPRAGAVNRWGSCCSNPSARTHFSELSFGSSVASRMPRDLPPDELLARGTILRERSRALVRSSIPIRHRSRFLQARVHGTISRLDDLLTIAQFQRHRTTMLLRGFSSIAV